MTLLPFLIYICTAIERNNKINSSFGLLGIGDNENRKERKYTCNDPKEVRIRIESVDCKEYAYVQKIVLGYSLM